MIFPIGDDNIKGGHFPLMSYAFLVINIAVFFLELAQGEGINEFIHTYGSIPAEITSGRDLFTLFTSMFLHAGIAHVVGNMLFLWIFADNIEAVIGSFRFLVFYLLGGLVAHAAHIFFNFNSEIPTVGASGAIAAVMGAYVVMFPTSRIKVLFLIFPFHVSAFVFLGFWIVSQFSSGLGSLQTQTAESSGVAYWAHIGGFVLGLVMGFRYRGEHQKMLKRGYRDEDLV
jgi:membrane associated rhomboid family serine protease